MDCTLQYTTWFESMSLSVSTVMSKDYLDLQCGQPCKLSMPLQPFPCMEISEIHVTFKHARVNSILPMTSFSLPD